MSQIPSHLKYTPAHEWVSDDGDNVYTAGITDFAQSQLGDVVFVELPEVGSRVQLNDSIAVVESVKAASDVYAPLAGEVVAINETLTDAPETLNTAPYEGGWLFKIKLSDDASLDHLLDADAYQQECQ
jgi:glycine cleavage system H protein